MNRQLVIRMHQASSGSLPLINQKPYQLTARSPPPFYES